MRARLQDVFATEIPLRTLFEATTVAELGLAVERLVVAEVAELSDADVEALLAREVES